MKIQRVLIATMFLGVQSDQAFSESSMPRLPPTEASRPSSQPIDQPDNSKTNEKPTKASPEAAHDLLQVIKSASGKKADSKK